MEILFISHKYPPTIGGMEKQCYELVSRIEKRHTVHKLILNKEDEGVVSFFYKVRKRAKQILKANPKIDLIYLNDGLMGFFSLWLKSYTSIPVVITFHGLDLVFPNTYFQNKVIPKFRYFDAFINVSAATAQECINRGFDPKKIHIVPNGVEHSLSTLEVDETDLKQRFREKYQVDLDHKNIIISLGRPVRRKGFSWFVEKVVPALDNDTLFIMVGPRTGKEKPPIWKRVLPKKWIEEINLFLGATNDESRLFVLAQKPEIQQKIIQTGSIPFQDVMGLLGLADLFVMPNVKVQGDAEGFGLVALEASLRGTPVLAAKLEGITEAVQHEKNGYLLPSENAGAWIEKINTLLQDKKKLKEQGETFKNYTLSQFSWEKMVDGYLTIFEEVVRKN